MSGRDVPNPGAEAERGQSVKADVGAEEKELQPEPIEVFRQRNREILEGLADDLGFRPTEEMSGVRQEAIEVFRSGDQEGFAGLMRHWHDLAVEVVDVSSGLELKKAGIGYMLTRAAIWQELGDAGNFWEEMAAATAEAQNVPELHLPLQGYIDRMSAGWQIPATQDILAAASGYIGPEEAQEMWGWLPDEVLTVVLVRLLQSGVRDVKAFLLEHGLLEEQA